MDFEDTKEEAAFRAEANKWLSANAKLRGSKSSKDDMAEMENGAAAEMAASRAWQKTKAKAGYARITWPKGMGGMGGTPMQSIIFSQEEAKYDVASGGPFAIGLGMCIPTLMTYGNDEAKKRFVWPAVQGDEIWCQLFSEPAGGSDVAGLRTKAEKDGDEYVLNGAKAFISGGGVSDVYVVMARSGGEGPKGISTFVVEKGAPGLSFGGQEKKLGWNSQPTAQVNFDNCRIPAENRVGGEGEGFRIAMMGLDGGRINIGACSLGGAAFALDTAKEYMSGRKQFGSPLKDFQALQFKIADMATEIEAARLMLHRGAWAIDTNHPRKTEYCAMAKRFATDACFDAANQALQLHGGYGYLKDYPLERILRDLRVHQILEGTNEIMRVIIAREQFRQ